MKTNKFKLMGLLMCFAAMMVTSCSSDESYATGLVGTWACSSSTSEEGDDSEVDHYKGQTVSFLENGTIQTSDDHSTIIEYDDDYAIAREGGLLGGKNGCSWAVLEGQLYINGGRSVWNIKKLTKTELKIETEQCLFIFDDYSSPDCHYTRVFKRQ